ncbi:MAG: DUF4258 domain-containing protein [Phycisphaeraceae bacterium]|nr:DUF4258 domain-containing protein [Phycisphaeraceae bacterium]
MTPRRADKPIWFQDHAISRMRQRGIARDKVIEAVRKPDRELSASRQDSTRFEKRQSSRSWLVVIVKEDADAIWIITAFRR